MSDKKKRPAQMPIPRPLQGESRDAEIQKALTITPEDVIEALQSAPPFLMTYLYAQIPEEDNAWDY